MTSAIESGPQDKALEGKLRSIWGELLDLGPQEVPTDISFLRLGGDSVLAVRMSALVRKQLSVELALSDVRVEITLGGLADLVRGRVSGDPSSRALPARVARRPDPHAPFPLLPLQQGYFVGQHDGWELSYDSAHYYLDYGLAEVEGDDAASALADAIERLAVHQPTLRARITSDGRQHVLPMSDPAAVPRLRVHDLREETDEVIARTLAEVRRDMSTKGPDPSKGPGLDLRLTLLPDDGGRLHLGLSLLVFDGWSSSVLNRDLIAFAADWNTTLPPLEIDFGDYVTSLADLSRSSAWLDDRDWWWAQLDSMPGPPALPLLADPKDVRPAVMGNREARLPPQRWAAFREECTRRDVTPSTAMLTVFSIVLARWAGHRRLLLNSLQLNRLPLHPDVHRVVGAFASTMFMPVELGRGESFAQLAAANQVTSGEHAAHNLVSGVEVGRELARRRGTRRPVGPVVFQSVLGVDAAMGGRPPVDGGPLGRVVATDYFHQLRTPQVALEVRCFELGSEAVAVFSLVEELFDHDEVSAAFAEFVALVEDLAEGHGWDEVPELPEAADPEPAGAEHRLGLLAEHAVERHTGPPADDIEQLIAEVFEDLLDVPVLDRGTDFFSLGGDSLLAVRALSRMAREIGASLPVREFLVDPTVAGAASALRPRLGLRQ